MKKKLVICLFFSLSAFALDRPDTPILSSNTYNQSDYFYTVQINYPVLNNCITKKKAKTCDKFNKLILKLVAKIKKDYSKSKLKKKQSMVDKVLKNKEITTSRNEKDKFRLKVTYDSYFKENELVSLIFKVQKSNLHSHGEISFHAINYDLKKQKSLKFNQVFNVKKDKLSKLNALLAHHMPKQNCLTSKPQISKKQSFMLTDTDYTFAFAPYELGPYKCGSVYITVPKDELKKNNILR